MYSFFSSVGRMLLTLAYTVWFLFMVWVMLKIGGWFFFGAPV